MRRSERVSVPPEVKEKLEEQRQAFDLEPRCIGSGNAKKPYAKPMECGNHEDVRWAALTGEIPGLLAQTQGNFMQVSALPYRDEQMIPIEYSVDLPASTATVLTLAARTLGVGSGSCGPRPLDRYMV